MVNQGSMVLISSFRTFSHGYPQNDVALGGSNDIYDGKVIISENSVVCNFKRKLQTGDSYDQILERGKTVKVCSYSSTSTNLSKHASKEVRYCFYWPLVDGYSGELQF